MMDEKDRRTMSSEQLHYSLLEARIKRLEKRIADYEWFMLFLFILVASRMFF